MNFEILKDHYYPHLYDRVRHFIPGYSSVHDDTPDLVWLIMSEFSSFLEQNLQDNRYWQFLNEALAQGGHDTRQVVVMEVFWNLYPSQSGCTMAEYYLTGKAKELFIREKAFYTASSRSDSGDDKNS